MLLADDAHVGSFDEQLVCALAPPHECRWIPIRALSFFDQDHRNCKTRRLGLTNRRFEENPELRKQSHEIQKFRVPQDLDVLPSITLSRPLGGRNKNEISDFPQTWRCFVESVVVYPLVPSGSQAAATRFGPKAARVWALRNVDVFPQSFLREATQHKPNTNQEAHEKAPQQEWRFSGNGRSAG